MTKRHGLSPHSNAILQMKLCCHVTSICTHQQDTKVKKNQQKDSIDLCTLLRYSSMYTLLMLECLLSPLTHNKTTFDASAGTISSNTKHSMSNREKLKKNCNWEPASKVVLTEQGFQCRLAFHGNIFHGTKREHCESPVSLIFLTFTTLLVGTTNKALPAVTSILEAASFFVFFSLILCVLSHFRN